MPGNGARMALTLLLVLSVQDHPSVSTDRPAGFKDWARSGIQWQALMEHYRVDNKRQAGLAVDSACHT